ncbi:MAG: zinc-dependent metalloprotease family protein [Armatimonadota bacterium]
MTTRRPFVFLMLCLALSLAGLARVSSSEISGTPEHPGIQLPFPVRGVEAIRALGPRLADVALHNRMTPAALQSAFLHNQDLWVDTGGRLVYSCRTPAELAARGIIPPVHRLLPRGTREPAPPFPTSQTFLLHSRPASNKKIYLDVDGHVTTGTGWNNGGTVNSVPWDLDGSPATWSTGEHEAIQKVWQRVAEDFAPFDIDVTTEDPGIEALRRLSDDAYGIRVVISPTDDWFGGAGGVAYIGSFNWDSDTPCFVFTDNVANSEKFVADAASHEVGHSLGLLHDGQTGGVEYYGGQGQWGPIMGAPYGVPITHWSNGDYRNANNQENDVVIFASFGGVVAADEAGDTLATAVTLNGTNPTVSGVINTRTDVDLYRFTTGNGPVNLVATPWVFSPNLDIKLELLSQTGTVLASADPAGFSASITHTLGAGTYYVRIDGVGAGDPLQTGYSDYGSLGAYYLNLSLQTGTLPIAPTNVQARATSSTTIDLTWFDNAHNEAAYEVERKTANTGFTRIATVASNATSFQDDTVSSGITYTYRLRATNAAGPSEYSNTPSATPPFSPPGTPILVAVTLNGFTDLDISWVAGVGSIDRFELQHREGATGEFSLLAELSPQTVTYKHQGLAPNSLHTYRVRATGPGGTSDWSTTLEGRMPPSTPTNLVATGSGGKIKLTWSHEGGVGFKVERKIESAPWVEIAQIHSGALEYTDSSLLTGVTASYRVRAFTSLHTSNYSNVATATTSAGTLTSLSVPKKAKGGSTVNGTVKLSPAAPSGGVVVQLSTNSKLVKVPKTVTIPSGKTSATFKIKTKKSKGTTTVLITASYAGTSREASMKVKK